MSHYWNYILRTKNRIKLLILNDEKAVVSAKNWVELKSEEIDYPGVSGDDTTVMVEKPPNNNYWDTIPDEIAELILEAIHEWCM